jgi:hypothetical protein
VGGELKTGKTTSIRSRPDGDDDLEEIAVVSINANPRNVKYGAAGTSALASSNGPRVVPGERKQSYVFH